MPGNSEELSGLDDFDRVVASLKRHQVDFLIIGGYAVIYHGYVRDTKDLDIFVRRTDENAKRTVAALEEADWGSSSLTSEVFTAGNGISLGEPPVQIDVLSNIKGVAFEDAWTRRETSAFGPNEVHYIALDDLIANKRAVGRLQDLADVEKLEIARKKA